MKKFIDTLKLPRQEEYLQLTPITHNYKVAARKDLWENGMFTKRYIQLQTVYRFLFSQFLLQTTQIDVIDQKIGKHELSFFKNNPENMNFYQRHDLMGTDYFYLRNSIHIERLEKGELAQLDLFLEQAVPEYSEAAKKFIENTYKKVLAFSEDEDFQEIQLFPLSYGEGNVPLASIVFMLIVIPEYDENGNIKDVKIQERKESILMSLKAQLEPIYSAILEMSVKIFIE